MNSFKPFTVLFLSTGNAARSILAEGLLREKGGDRFIARSAGLRPVMPQVNPHTLALLASEGIAINGLHTKNWGEFLASASMFSPSTSSSHCRKKPVPTVLSGPAIRYACTGRSMRRCRRKSRM